LPVLALVEPPAPPVVELDEVFPLVLVVLGAMPSTRSAQR
jgi:hypothetical protein